MYKIGQKLEYFDKTLEPPEEVEVCAVNEDGTYNVFVRLNGIRYISDNVPAHKLKAADRWTSVFQDDLM